MGVKIHSEKKDRMLRNASLQSSFFVLSKSAFSLSISLLMLSLVVLTDTAPIASKSNLNRKDILASFRRVAASINNITASLMKIGAKLKEDETSNEIAIKSNSAEETKFYGIYEEIFLGFPA